MSFKAALITGAAQRMGKAMAISLAKRGTDVAVHYAGSHDAAVETVAQLKALGVNAVALQADLLQEDQRLSLINRATQALGKPLDVLINNASVFEYDTLQTATLTSWDRHMGSNLRAPFVLTQHFATQAPTAIPDENGEPEAQAVVINMCDMRLRKLSPEFMTYTLAKSALWTFTQTAAQSLAPNIRINAIGPGPTIQGYKQSEAHFANQRNNTVLKRGSNPSEIVAAMNFILDCSGLTGQLLCIDGGQHLGWKTPDMGGIETI